VGLLATIGDHVAVEQQEEAAVGMHINEINMFSSINYRQQDRKVDARFRRVVFYLVPVAIQRFRLRRAEGRNSEAR
jgi:hypothetical protein